MKFSHHPFLRCCLTAAMTFPLAITAYADTALTTGQTIIDTTGNPALGVISRSTGATALFNTAGIATATGTPIVNGILGPWASIGTGTATRYATLDGSNNVVSYTAGTANTWGGALNSATANYVISTNGTATYGGSERTANTILYTGGAGSVISLGNSSAFGLTVNGIINAGTGTITFQPGGGALAGAGIHIGATQELVLNAANAAITITSPIHNNTGGASAVTVVGSNTVTLSGVNTYTGATTIGSGTLALGAAGSISASSGVSLGTVGTFNVSAKGLSGYTVNKLTGSGNVTGALTVSTQLAPGTVNFSSNLTLGSTSTYLYDLTGGSNTADLGDIAGGLTIAAGAVLDLVQLGTYTANQKFTLFAYDGALSGSFTGLADDATFTDAGGSWMINYNDTTAGLNGGVSGSNTYVTITAVPEPGAALLCGLGALALLRRRRL
jgi:autotransporter-associated beta strand protein